MDEDIFKMMLKYEAEYNFTFTELPSSIFKKNYVTNYKVCIEGPEDFAQVEKARLIHGLTRYAPHGLEAYRLSKHLDPVDVFLCMWNVEHSYSCEWDTNEDGTYKMVFETPEEEDAALDPLNGVELNYLETLAANAPEGYCEWREECGDDS